MKRFASLVAAVAFGSALATPGNAGVVDSPLPAPFTQHVFTVPGVMETGILATGFHCTNLHKEPVTIGVELFPNPGGGPYNDAAAISSTVDPGATVLFATSPLTNGVPGDLDIGGAGMGRGSARILATSKSIACTAFVIDPLSVPPATSWQLTIIKGTKQKAAN